MKFLAWLVGIAASLIAIAYVVVFTSFGNGIIKPIIESKIKENTKLNSKLTTFSLSMSQFEIFLELNSNNTLSLKGNYSLSAQSFDIVYDLKLKKLESLQPLTVTPLQGELKTNGSINGDMAFMKINGKSDVAKSDTTYYIELTDLNPTSIIAKTKEAKLSSLLYIGSQNQYASADINLDINFKNIKPHMLDGDILLKTKNGKLNSKLMKRDFNVTIPSTSFTMNLDATLKGDNVDYKYNLSSNLFKILSSGKIIPEPFKSDIKYSLNIKELAVLKPIIGSDLRGKFRLDGTVKGTKEKLVVNGKSDVASSDTKFELLLKDFAPLSVEASIKKLKLKKALYMLNQPYYTDGELDLKANISNLKSDSLKGEVSTVIKKGFLNSKYLTKAYEFKSPMPRITFNSNTTTTLDKDLADTKIDFNSNIANLDVKRARFNISDASLKSDYIVNISNLDKLYFILQQDMKGSITANGEISKAKDLDFTMHTKVAGGIIDVKLHNDDFSADLKSVQTMELLHMLKYPEIFKATLDAKIKYDLASSKGIFTGGVVDGNFANNKTFNLIKKYTKFDMYRESFNGDINAIINKEKIIASLDLRSKQASIKAKEAKIDTKKQTIDSDITFQAKKNIITANLSGDINSPKVKIDLEKFMKSKAGEKVNKELNKLFKKFF
ncbi:MAG: hypothetical protein L3J10_10475 [Sulfurimonas sp.]|nr:hypothetical protein [Sulfurimonas sp.]